MALRVGFLPLFCCCCCGEAVEERQTIFASAWREKKKWKKKNGTNETKCFGEHVERAIRMRSFPVFHSNKVWVVSFNI